MHIDLSLPVLVRAQPAATKKDGRYFFGSHIHRAEVPEISLSETEIALGPMAIDSLESGRRIFPVLRAYDGRLFRPIGNAPGLLTTAFPPASSSRTAPYMMSSPPITDMKGGPIASPILDRFYWFSAVHGMNTARNARLWPEEDTIRNTTFIEKSDLRDINHDDLFACQRMHAAQSDRLLLVDGKMWMETTMPCISVAYRFDGQSQAVTTSLGYLPLVPTGFGTTVRFPLDMARDAGVYAHRIACDVGKLMTTDLPRLEVPEDTSAVEFDQNAEELHEFAWGIASNVVRAVEQRSFHKQHQNAPPLFEGTERVRFENMKEELLASNDIIGERRDLADCIPDIMDMWATAKKSRYAELWDPSTDRVASVVRRKLDLFDDRAINLPLGAPRLTLS